MLLIICSGFLSINGYGQSKARIENIDFNLVGDDIIITYDIINSAPGEKFDIEIEIFTESGKKPDAKSLSGDVGKDVAGGRGKSVTWNFQNDNADLTEGIYVEVNATAHLVPEVKKKPARRGGSLGGAFVKSLVFPGWGNSSISGGPYWLMGFVGYGCIAGSVMMNQQASQSYDDYLKASDAGNRDNLFSDAESKDQLSKLLFGVGAVVWVTDLTILLIKGNNPRTYAYNTSRTSPLVGYTIDPISKKPMLSVRITF
ncbi:MAG: hypothetical protein GH151_06515 [Bacteroidetes bacterium]|nr:hypothetical protein [Bacteroidota bacterium]